MTTIARTATLAGFEGTLTRQGPTEGEWRAHLSPEALVTLLQAAAEGQEVSLDDHGGAHRVVIRRCWYDVEDLAIRARFEVRSLPA